MHFPVNDVVKNIRYFLTVVKRATGNIRDPKAEATKKDTSQKPSKFAWSCREQTYVTYFSSASDHASPPKLPAGS